MKYEKKIVVGEKSLPIMFLVKFAVVIFAINLKIYICNKRILQSKIFQAQFQPFKVFFKQQQQ